MQITDLKGDIKQHCMEEYLINKVRLSIIMILFFGKASLQQCITLYKMYGSHLCCNVITDTLTGLCGIHIFCTCCMLYFYIHNFRQIITFVSIILLYSIFSNILHGYKQCDREVLICLGGNHSCIYSAALQAQLTITSHQLICSLVGLSWPSKLC